VNVGHLGAVDALVDPAHNIAHELSRSESNLFMNERSPVKRDSVSVRPL
jgi:hypothetical protein